MSKRFAALLCAALFVLAGALAAAEGNWLESVMPGRGGRNASRSAYVAELAIYGELTLEDYEYDHYGTLDAIDELTWDRDNIGLILLLDTPGGSVYEMDELYHALEVYKEETGRPVYAYMERECCSAGVFVAMAAEHIAAARMTLTGSVGVYMQEDVSVDPDSAFIVSGANKLNGFGELTGEQREIYQAIVDESFEIFKGAIAASRGEQVASDERLLDGRVLTAAQALEIGLIDEVLYYDEALDVFYELGHFGNAELVDVTPDPWYGFWNDGDGKDEEEEEKEEKTDGRFLPPGESANAWRGLRSAR